MLSDEEKKAIAEVKDVIEYDKKQRIVTIYDKQHLFRDTLQTLLNLIEKQSKEIEELKRKEQLIKTYKGNLPENVELICLSKNDFERNISDDYISKDKIKAEIEELKNMTVEGEVFTTSVNFARKVLKSLLAEE